MTKVFSHMTMSLDGFVADASDDVGELFDWYEAGDVSVESHFDQVKFDVDEGGAVALRELTDNAGALVTGRRLFDIADGWNDTHPSGAAVVVITHNPPEDAAERWPETVFASDVESGLAKAREVAGEKDVTIASADITQQALRLGLVDEICVSLVPVLFGEGVSYFGKLTDGHLVLEDPRVIPGRRAVHLMYEVRR